METKELIKQLTAEAKSNKDISKGLTDELLFKIASFELFPQDVLFAVVPEPNKHFNYHIHKTKDCTLGRLKAPNNQPYIWMVEFNKNLIVKFSDYWSTDDYGEFFAPNLVYIGSGVKDLDFEHAVNYCAFNNQII